MSSKQIKAEIKQLRKQLYAEYHKANYRLLCITFIMLILVAVAALISGRVQL